MPFEEMARLWISFSGRSLEEFWMLSAWEFEQWFKAMFASGKPFLREDLNKLMERYDHGN